MIQPGSQQPQQEPPKEQQQPLRGRAAAVAAPEAGALGPGAGRALSESSSLEVVNDMFGAEYNSLKQQQHDADAAAK